MMPVERLFVTGTDTGIGKTHSSVALLHALRAHGLRAVGMKPIASGCWSCWNCSMLSRHFR